jgi:hypothetical protein
MMIIIMTDAKLMTKSINFVIAQEQWLAWVHVTRKEEDATQECRFPVDPFATTKEVK